MLKNFIANPQHVIMLGALVAATAVPITAALTSDTPTPPTPPVVSDIQLPTLSVSAPTPTTAPTTTPEVQEDDPAWDCRIMGDHECGAQVYNSTDWYIITFDAEGLPVSVRVR